MLLSFRLPPMGGREIQSGERRKEGTAANYRLEDVRTDKDTRPVESRPTATRNCIANRRPILYG